MTKSTNLDLSKLPELCYAFIGGNAPGERIGIIKRGESGYHLTDFDSATAPEEIVKNVIKEFNQKLGVDECTAEAMMIGSMCGWHVPGANPENLRPHYTRMGRV